MPEIAENQKQTNQKRKRNRMSKTWVDEFTEGTGIRWIYAREQKGLTQKEAAKALAELMGRGYASSTLGRIERGEISANEHVLKAAATLYGTTMDFLAAAPWANNLARNATEEAVYFSPTTDKAAHLIDAQPEECRLLCLASVQKTIEEYEAYKSKNKLEWEKLLRILGTIADSPLRDRLLEQLGVADFGKISIDEFLSKLDQTTVGQDVLKDSR